MKRLLPVLLASSLLAGSAITAEPVKVDSLLLSLLQVQDRIARGDAGALPLQKHLMKLLDAGIAEAGSVSEMSDGEFRALITFGIVGTGSSAVVEALREVEKPKKNRKLAQAVIDYRLRRRNQATKRFAEIRSTDLDARLIPFVAFAKGNLYSRKAPKQAIKQYDLVRLSAPGTLLEEASIRRLMSLHAAFGQGEPFARMAKQYARRFIHSPYRNQYLKMLRKGVFTMRRTISLEDVGELGELMPPDFAVSFHMHLVRGALDTGHIKLAKYSIEKIERLASEHKATPVNPVQLQLFQSLAEMTTQDPNVLLKELDALDEKRLAAADKRLLQKARGILGYIVAPIDGVQTNSTEKLTSGSIESEESLQKTASAYGDASSRPSSSVSMEVEKNESELDRFIGDTHKRLSDIDSLLSK